MTDYSNYNFRDWDQKLAWDESEKKQKEMDTNQSTLSKTQKEAQEKINSTLAKGQEYYNQAKQSLPEGLAPETFMDKIIRPVIEVITKYIMENYLTEENITMVSELMQSIVEDFFDRLDKIAENNSRVKDSVSKLKSMILKSISREARKTVVDDNNGIEMNSFGGKRRRRHTKKRRGSKRRY